MGKKYIVVLLLFSVVFSILTGCGPTKKEEVVKKEEVELIISAAASLTDAMEEIKTLYAEGQPHVKLTMNYGSSGTLQQQIEQGAPADVFMSAAPKQMNTLEEKDLINKETRRDLLENKMVLIVSKDVADIKDFTDLAGDKIKNLAIGTPDSVPAGKYAQEILQKIALWDQVQPKLVLAKDVRQVLTYVETGDCQAGIVYETDAKISDKVKVAAYAPEKSHSPILYPVAIIKTSKYVEAAKDFLDFLNEDKAKKVFEKYGFTYLTN